MTTHDSKSFRTDVNGLRAFAVAAVLLFHIKSSQLPGGFAGVDVFFVISGYLMSQIISERLGGGTFSLAAFYLDRWKRIVPALAFVCASVAVYGWASLPPLQYKSFGQQLFSSLVFFSNYTDLAEANYFDQSFFKNWLLHTWSLSVEAQFYLFYPILLAGIFRLREQPLPVTRSLCLIAVAYSILGTRHHAEWGFYSIDTRAWELLLGGIAYFARGLRWNTTSWLTYFGILVVVVSLGTLSSKYQWPGLATLPPTMGTALILYSGGRNALLDNPVAQRIGAASYSIYLAHWPIVVWFTTNYPEMSLGPQFACLAASLLCGFMLNRYVENIVRGKLDKTTAHTRRLIRVASTVAATLVFGIVAFHQNGFRSRYAINVASSQPTPDEDTFDMYSLINLGNPWQVFDVNAEWKNYVCFTISKEKTTAEIIEACWDKRPFTVYLWGDSIAASLLPGMKLIEKSDPRIGSFLYAEGNGSPFFNVDGVAGFGKKLIDLNNERLEIAKIIKPDIVLLTWMMFSANGLQKEQAVDSIFVTADLIRKASPGTRVKMLGPVPMWGKNLVDIYLEYYKQHQKPLPVYSDVELQMLLLDWDQYFKDRFRSSRVDYISAMDVLCKERKCLTRLGPKGTDIATVDFIHPTPKVAEYLFERIRSQLLD